MDIEYRVIDRSHTEQYSQLVHSAMLDEPTCRSIGLFNHEEMDQFLKILLPSLDSGLTVGAFDAFSGQLIGCRSTVLKKLSDPTGNMLDATKPDERKLAIIMAFDEWVHKGVDVFRETGCSDVVHFFGLMVHRDYRRRGIARRLVEEAVQVAKSKGYHAIRAEASSNFSRRIFDKMGFRQLVAVRFDKFIFDGELVFKSTYPHEISTVHCLNI